MAEDDGSSFAHVGFVGNRMSEFYYVSTGTPTR